MMKIGELAGMAGVNPKTIRYYESIGVLPEPARTASGYRDYDGSFLDRLTFIRSAQTLGVTLDEIREILLFSERGEAPCSYVRGVLTSQLEGIGSRIRELELLRDQLTEIVSEAARLSPEVQGCTCRLIEHVRLKAGPAPVTP
ncbi:heavy metal-responsive transcriptional regulator [Arthrobacter sp. BB-1]|uniref:heavy metal-responsive transcriptional regulator n=1 Tax=unclassified Arthrobacter TaxID=235627 RepID=UPI001112BF44|nr:MULTISPECIES: heavy metal-responsive transcriptional regulator [unclassified Arthrobacter]TNB75669.1 heavy metal-responsive transcriptional regulator [Arthrobacter sp. BB-1]